MQGGGDIPPLFIEQRHLRWLAAGVSDLAALFVGSIASSQWLVALTCLNATPFGEVDPVLGRDASFYIFTLPFLDVVRHTILAIVLFSFIVWVANS